MVKVVEMEEEAYLIIDNFLAHLVHHKQDRLLSEDFYSKAGHLAIDMLKKYNLVIFLHGTKISPMVTPVSITEEGRAAVQTGSVKRWITDNGEKIELEKKQAEFEKARAKRIYRYYLLPLIIFLFLLFLTIYLLCK